MKIFERNSYRKSLGPVYDNEKENWKIVTNEEIYAIVKKPTITENERKQSSQKSTAYEFGNRRLRGRPRKRWQDEAREDGRIVGVEGWKEKVYNREVWQKLLRMARTQPILHIRMA